MRAHRSPLCLVTLLLLGTLIGCTPEAPAQPEVSGNPLEIMYLANEGFLLASGGDKVLIDGLFRSGTDDYASLPFESNELVETAEPPFDTVSVVLATHHHADHFHAASVCRYLASNPLAEFVSTQQTLDQLRKVCNDPRLVAGRVRTGVLEDGSPDPFVSETLRVEPVRLHHGAVSLVENLGFVIDMGGLTVLHMGDSQVEPEGLRAALGQRSIDVAFVPFWYFIDPRWTPALTDVLQAKALVVMHLPPRGSAQLVRYQGWDALVGTITKRFPTAIAFSEPFETRIY